MTMRCVLSIIMCVMFLVNASGEVQHVYMGKWDPLYVDLVLTIDSVEDKTYPTLKIANKSDEDMEIDITTCIITLKSKIQSLHELIIPSPIEKIKFGKDSYVMFRIKIESPELEKAEIITVILKGRMIYKKVSRTFSILGEKIL